MPRGSSSSSGSGDNGITGAVTGGGYGSWQWLAIVLGIIVVLGAGYLIFRRRK